MGLETTCALAGIAGRTGDQGAGAGQETSDRPASGSELPPRASTPLVLWDEIGAGPTGPWPSGGTLLFLWPHLPGDLRRPAWAHREGEAEDEYAPWWNREDSKVSAALLLPFYAELVASLSARAGPARFEFADRFQAARAYFRRFVPGRRQRRLPGAVLARAASIELLTGLVEGVERSDPSTCTVTFGHPGAAILHARRDERCVWLWLTPRVREGFDRFLDGVGGVRFDRRSMDWSETGSRDAGPPVAPGAGPVNRRRRPTLTRGRAARSRRWRRRRRSPRPRSGPRAAR